MGVVPLNQCVTTILNFDSGNAFENFVVFHVNVVAHSHVNSRIGNAAEYIVCYQSVLSKLWEDAVNARINDPVVADQEVVSCLTHNAISFVLNDLEVLDQCIRT